MEKPDLKQLGLGIGEDVAVAVLEKIVKPYAKFLIAESENKFDDMLLPFVDQLVDALKEQAEKIDISDNVPVA